MNDRVEGIRQRFSDAVSNEGVIGPQAMKALAVNCCHELLDEYTDVVRVLALKNDEIGKLQFLLNGATNDFDAACRRIGNLMTVVQALQEDDLHILLEGGDAIVDAKSKVRKRWMIVTGLTYDELQEIAPMKPGHEL